jgi:hypothetical protein
MFSDNLVCYNDKLPGNNIMISDKMLFKILMLSVFEVFKDKKR